jgi:hypothetical protein
VPEYAQPQKRRARTLALSHAIEILTSRREFAAVVAKGYVAKVKQTLQERENRDAYVAGKCDAALIEEWENLRESRVGQKAPSDLTVAYLTGPEPLNDFRELVRLGVHPHNIFGFESEKKEFNLALLAAKASEFPLLKIIKMPFDRYLQAVPMTFDVIYFDACGPFPSTDQRTLRTVANIFRYQRLNPLSVLITNFAAPDEVNPPLRRAYADLITGYLYPRGMHESEDKDWNLTDGPIAHGMVPKDEGEDDSFFDAVLNDLPRYYGNYVTRQLFDLGSFIVPLTRLASGGSASLWNVFFTKSAEELGKLAKLRSNFDAEGGGGNYIIDAELNALGWSFSALLNANEPGDYPAIDPLSTPLIQTWAREIGGSPDASARDAVEAYYLLKDSRDKTQFQPAMANLITEYAYLKKMHMFCDMPSGELALFPVMAQFSFPYHYNVAETRRYRYRAEGKSTDMFLDVIPFDACRYLYDWLPSTELVSESFDFEGHQLVYRFALDALLKHSIRYNKEFVFGGHVVGVNNQGFTERLLMPREIIT